MSTPATLAKATPERISELHIALAEIKAQVQQVSDGRSSTLVAVSKYRPASDILACHEAGQKDFGENYIQELAEKAQQVSLFSFNGAVACLTLQGITAARGYQMAFHWDTAV